MRGVQPARFLGLTGASLLVPSFLRKQEPIPTGFRSANGVRLLTLSRHFAVWVPAFAGTTRGLVDLDAPLLLAARIASESWKTRALREQRAQGMPGVRCTRGLACEMKSTRDSHHRFTGSVRHSLRDGFTAYSALSPVIGLSCHRRLAVSGGSAQGPTSPPPNLTPASGCQDHTTSPSASARFVKRAARVHRIPHPTFVTIAKRPS
jgi:hypothetical protein